jgi:hypothetical protein
MSISAAAIWRSVSLVLPGLFKVARGVGEGDVGAGLVGCPEGAGALVLLHERSPLAHHVVVAALLVAERLLHLLGVLAGLFETRLDIYQARLGFLFLLDHLDGGLPLAPACEFAGLAFLDGQDLLLRDGVVGEHLLVGHRAGRRDLELLQVLKLVLDRVLEQYLGVALLDPGEEPPEETANSPSKSSHLCRPPPAVVTPAKSSWIISSVRTTPERVSKKVSARSGFVSAFSPPPSSGRRLSALSKSSRSVATDVEPDRRRQ